MNVCGLMVDTLTSLTDSVCQASELVSVSTIRPMKFIDQTSGVCGVSQLTTKLSQRE